MKYKGIELKLDKPYPVVRQILSLRKDSEEYRVLEPKVIQATPFLLLMTRRYFLGIYLGEDEDNMYIQTYGYCPTVTRFVVSKYRPIHMAGPKGKLP